MQGIRMQGIRMQGIRMQGIRMQRRKRAGKVARDRVVGAEFAQRRLGLRADLLGDRTSRMERAAGGTLSGLGIVPRESPAAAAIGRLWVGTAEIRACV